MTRRLAYLACAGTLPGSPSRRADAFEHDRMVGRLRPALAAYDLELIEVDWQAPPADSAGVAAVLVGTPWDYHDHEEAFIARLRDFEGRGIPVFNDSETIAWNADKRYLQDLAAAGITTIPTLWHDNPDCRAVTAALDHFGCDSVVVKRQVGAGAEGQYRFAQDDLPSRDWEMGHRAMIQPYLPSIVDEGELTFVFIAGVFSHAVRKTAAAGDYRIQSLYGGEEAALTPATADLIQAQAVLEALPVPDPLYVRIDMIRAASGKLAVMEAELIEPYLYPEQGPELGAMLAAALNARL